MNSKSYRRKTNGWVGADPHGKAKVNQNAIPTSWHHEIVKNDDINYPMLSDVS